eukprot:4731544-Prymnesium_polylepis.2
MVCAGCADGGPGGCGKGGVGGEGDAIDSSAWWMRSRTPSTQHVLPATTDVAPAQLTSITLVTYSVSITAGGLRPSSPSASSSSSSVALTSSRNCHPSAVWAWIAVPQGPVVLFAVGGPMISTDSSGSKRSPTCSAAGMPPITQWVVAGPVGLPAPPSARGGNVCLKSVICWWASPITYVSA